MILKDRRKTGASPTVIGALDEDFQAVEAFGRSTPVIYDCEQC